MDDKDMRPIKTLPNCTLGASTGPQTIVVRQVVAEKEKQKSLDIHVVVPDSKPAIEQIVDVFIKDVEINSVDVITDKVIVRGEFEIKAIYVACLPDRPVHAMEVKHYKWTVDIDMPGARRGMDASAMMMMIAGTTITMTMTAMTIATTMIMMMIATAAENLMFLSYCGLMQK
ncbi:MAG: hypothetical protein K0Q75_893 [Anaerospora sp.]|nr:hypothetical protein [Anaerospora sp.]